MLAFAQKNNKEKKTATKEEPLTMEEATTYLKKIGEWDSVARLERKVILDWAEFLKHKGVTK